MRRCRRCSEPFEPVREHYHTCARCWQPAPSHQRQRVQRSAAAKLAAAPGQMSLLEPIGEEGEWLCWLGELKGAVEPEPESEFVRWADANPVRGTAAAA
jgi:hypothetical protein